MTPGEWAEITEKLVAWWPRSSTPVETFAAWFEELQSFPAAIVCEAIENKRLGEWPPNLGEIHREAVTVTSRLAWDVCGEAIRRKNVEMYRVGVQLRHWANALRDVRRGQPEGLTIEECLHALVSHQSEIGGGQHDRLAVA